jgi:hypothetical protein
MKRQDILPVVLFELSVMRTTVRRFPSRAEPESRYLLERLALLESKALRLIDMQGQPRRVPMEH